MSKYLIDPCSTSWVKYLRRMAVVIKCVNIWCRRSAGFSKIGNSDVIDVQVGEEEVAANSEALQTLRPHGKTQVQTQSCLQ